MYTVLLADDERGWVEALDLVFKKEDNFRVIGKAYDGKDVLNQIRASCPEVLLLDFAMPECDGQHIVHEVRQMQGYNPIIYIITAIENRTTQAILNKMDIDYYSIKPIYADRVLEILRSIVDVKRSTLLKDAGRVRKQIDIALRSMDVPLFHVSSRHLREAIYLYAQNEEQYFSSGLYPKVASTFNTNAKAIERNIRTAIKIAAKVKTERFRELFPDQRRVTNAEFIFTVANYVKGKF